MLPAERHVRDDGSMVASATRPARVGIIGLGGFAWFHHRVLSQLSATGEAELVCTCDPRAHQFSAEMDSLQYRARGVRVFDDYRTMLDHCAREIDYVVIPTPIPLHAEMHRACIDRGVAVYLEKPPTLDPAELEAMIETDRRAAVPTLVGFNFIGDPKRRELKQRILDRAFGVPSCFSLHAAWRRPLQYFQRNTWAGKLRTSDGRLILDSCLGNAMAHYVHNLLHWAGPGSVDAWALPVTGRARLLRGHSIEGADTFFVSADLETGARLRLAMTHLGEEPQSQYEEIVCSEATVRYIVGSHAEIHWKDGRIEHDPVPRYEGVLENHRRLQQMIQGRAARPFTRLEDCRAFVHLNAFAYLSTGRILDVPPELMRVLPPDEKGDVFVATQGLQRALASFVEGESWCDSSFQASPETPALVTTRDLPRLASTVADLQSFGRVPSPPGSI